MMRMMIRLVMTAILAVVIAATADAQPGTPSGDDAWPLYERAAARVEQSNQLGLSCPAASVLEYADYPPFPPEWHRLANRAFDTNEPARKLVRQARACGVARWPVAKAEDGCRGWRGVHRLRQRANQ